jgi:hypothetical protein
VSETLITMLRGANFGLVSQNIQGLGTPSLFHPASMTASHRPHSGTGTGEPQQRLRAEETIHLSGVPFWKRGGEALPADIWKETGPIWPGLSGTI